MAESRDPKLGGLQKLERVKDTFSLGPQKELPLPTP